MPYIDDLNRTFEEGDEVIISVPAANYLGTQRHHGTIKTASWYRPTLVHLPDRGLVIDGGWLVELTGPKGGYMYWKQGADGGQIEHENQAKN